MTDDELRLFVRALWPCRFVVERCDLAERGNDHLTPIPHTAGVYGFP